MSLEHLKTETLALHAGQQPDPTTGASAHASPRGKLRGNRNVAVKYPSKSRTEKAKARSSWAERFIAELSCCKGSSHCRRREWASGRGFRSAPLRRKNSPA